ILRDDHRRDLVPEFREREFAGRRVHAPRRPADRVSVPEGGTRRFHRRNQISLLEVEDEQAPPQVRRLFRRPVRLGAARSLTPGLKTRPTASGVYKTRPTLKIRSRVIQPVLADRTEDIELERVVERFGLVLDPGRNMKD